LNKKTKKVQHVAPVVEDYEEVTEDDKITELATENFVLQAENIRLRDAIAVGKLNLPEVEINNVEDTITQLRADLSRLEGELESMTLSRNDYQKKAADAIKQVQYWKRIAQKNSK